MFQRPIRVARCLRRPRNPVIARVSPDGHRSPCPSARLKEVPISVRGAASTTLRMWTWTSARPLVVTPGWGSANRACLDTIYAMAIPYFESSRLIRAVLEIMQSPMSTTSRAVERPFPSARTTSGPAFDVGRWPKLRLPAAALAREAALLPATGRPIESQPSQIATASSRSPSGRGSSCSRPSYAGSGGIRKELASSKEGVPARKVDGTVYDLGQVPALDKKLKHDIEVVVDRIAVRPDIGNRLPDSISTALGLAEGLLIVEFADQKENGEPKRLIMSSKFACPVSGFTIPEIDRGFFVQQSKGLSGWTAGRQTLFHPNRGTDATLSLRKGASQPWARSYLLIFADARSIARHIGPG